MLTNHVVKHVALMRDEYFIVNWGMAGTSSMLPYAGAGH